MEHKYHLQKYTKPSDKKTCPKCGRKGCFKLYVDEHDVPIDITCGRCEHENSCGYHLPPKEWFKYNYHLPPKEWFKSNPGFIPKNYDPLAEGLRQPAEPKKMITIPKDIITKSHSEKNTLLEYLLTWVKFPQAKLFVSYNDYLIGSTKEGHIIFWQIDENFVCHTGKLMYYKPDGHRLKSEEYQKAIKEGTMKPIKYGPTNWIHSILIKLGKIDEHKFELQQCLFGLHLLNLPGNEDKPVAIVESEKSAFLCSIAAPQYLWMATGGICNLNAKMLEPIIRQKRRIILYPDLDGYKKFNDQGKPKTNWIDKATELKQSYSNVELSPFVKQYAIPAIDGYHCDVADIMLRRMDLGPDLLPEELDLGLTEPHEALRYLKREFDLVRLDPKENLKENPK